MCCRALRGARHAADGGGGRDQGGGEEEQQHWEGHQVGPEGPEEQVTPVPGSTGARPLPPPPPSYPTPPLHQPILHPYLNPPDRHPILRHLNSRLLFANLRIPTPTNKSPPASPTQPLLHPSPPHHGLLQLHPQRLLNDAAQKQQEQRTQSSSLKALQHHPRTLQPQTSPPTPSRCVVRTIVASLVLAP